MGGSQTQGCGYASPWIIAELCFETVALSCQRLGHQLNPGLLERGKK